MNTHPSSGGFRPRTPSGDDIDLITSARSLLADRAPYISRMLFRCPILDCSGYGTNGTDGRGRIYIDFSALHEADLDPGQRTARLAALILAALWRILRRHDVRQTLFDDLKRQAWDLSSTAVCNRDALPAFLPKDKIGFLLDDGGAQTYGLLPSPAVTPLSLARAFDLDFLNVYVIGRSETTATVEDLYAELVRSMGNSDGDAQGQDQDDTSGQTGEHGQELADGSGDGSVAEDESDQGKGQTGSHGNPSGMFTTFDPNSLDPEDARNPRNCPLNDQDIDRLAQSVAEDIAHQMSSGRGDALPESVTEWSTDRLVPPVIDPLDLFRSDMGGRLDTARSGSRGTYGKRSRRQASMGTSRVVLEGRVNEVTTVYVGLDVSGSMSDDEHVRNLSEIAALGKERGLEIKYFSVSTMPHEVRTLESGQTPTLDRDNAGTDMRMAFTLFDEHRAKLRIILTDGYTPWPAEVMPGTYNIAAITAPDRSAYENVIESIPAEIQTVWLPPSDYDPRAA